MTARSQPTVAETQGVWNVVRDARGKGHACIIVARSIHHVFQVVGRIVVLRRGEVADDGPSPSTSSLQDVETIIPRDHLAA